jgi:hypothetical protein
MDILIIEADPDLASNLCDILALDGHRVVSAKEVRKSDVPIERSRLGAILIDTFSFDHIGDAFPPDLCEAVPQVTVRFIAGHNDVLAAVNDLRKVLAGGRAGRLSATVSRSETISARRAPLVTGLCHHSFRPQHQEHKGEVRLGRQECFQEEGARSL